MLRNHAHEPLGRAEARYAARALQSRIQCLQDLLDAQVQSLPPGDHSWAVTSDELDLCRRACEGLLLVGR